MSSLQNIDGRYRDRCTGLYNSFVHPVAQGYAWSRGKKHNELSKVEAMQLHIEYLFKGTEIKNNETQKN